MARKRKWTGNELGFFYAWVLVNGNDLPIKFPIKEKKEKIRPKPLPPRAFHFVCARWRFERSQDVLKKTPLHKWKFMTHQIVSEVNIGSVEALPILLCVRCARWEREREKEREREREREREKRERKRERERERDWDRREWRHLRGAKIGDEFCTFPFQKRAPEYWRRALHFSLPKICTSFFSLEWRLVHTFRCQKGCTLRNRSHSSFCFCQMAWQGIEALKQQLNFRLHRPSSHRKNESN